MTEAHPYLDYEPDTVSIESIASSLAFLATQEALRQAPAAAKPRTPVSPASTPLWASQGHQARQEQR